MPFHDWEPRWFQECCPGVVPTHQPGRVRIATGVCLMVMYAGWRWATEAIYGPYEHGLSLRRAVRWFFADCIRLGYAVGAIIGKWATVGALSVFAKLFGFRRAHALETWLVRFRSDRRSLIEPALAYLER